jgi:hypothetical protein
MVHPKKEQALTSSLQIFRAAHRARVMSYLEQPAPERLMMTAGKSVLEGSASKNLAEALKPLDDMLSTRLRETSGCCRATEGMGGMCRG